MVRDHSNPKTLAKSAKAQATGVKTGNLRTKGESLLVARSPRC